MGTVTPNLRLNVPDFDQAPWDQDVNTNWHVLDATVGMFSAIPNLVGVWKNSTAYVYGQSTIDAVDSSIWMCAQSHTSSALPTAFSLERVQYPARWSQTSAGAQFYATQAQNAASSAAASAIAAENAAASVGSMVPIAGGTMTGPLVLYGDPVGLLEPTTRQYVDARVGGTGYLPITGGVLTGPLTVGGTGITYANQAPNSHAMSFGWNGSQVLVGVDGVYFGAMASQAYVSGSFLPLTGGTVSGTIVVNGETQTDRIYRINMSGAYFHSNPTETLIQWDSGGWALRYTRNTGTLWYRRSDGANLFAIDSGGSVSLAVTLTAGVNVVTNGNTNSSSYFRNGRVFFGAGDRSYLGTDNSTYTDVALLDAYRWQLNWSTGTLAWRRWDDKAMVLIDVNGSGYFSGDLSNGGSMNTTNLSATNTVYSTSQQMAMGGGGAGRILQFSPNWYFEWAQSGGDLHWVTTRGEFIGFHTGDNQLVNYFGGVSANGGYTNISDERMKTDIEPSTHGLDAIAQLEPISFKREDSEVVEHGFSAQRVREVIPEAVRERDDGMLGVSLDPIVAALVNGMKELAQRIDKMENKQ